MAFSTQFQVRRWRAAFHFYLLNRRRDFARAWRQISPWPFDGRGRGRLGKPSPTRPRLLRAEVFRRLDKIFCERHLVFQGGGVLWQIRMTPFKQGIVVSLAMGLFIWLVISQIWILNWAPALEAEIRRADDLAKAYEALDGEMMAAIELIDTLNRRLKVQ